MKKVFKTLISTVLCATMCFASVLSSPVVKADVAEEQIAVYDVMGLTVVCPPDNTISVMWNKPMAGDTDNYRYNVYLNGKLEVEKTSNLGVVFTEIPAGANVVTVTSVYMGVETAGVRKYALVRGVTYFPETTAATVETTTAASVEIIEDKQNNLEVIGLVASSPKENTVGVVWGQDAARMDAGCKYDVYVNGVKKFTNVPCAYYTVEGVNAGEAEVKVVSVVNSIESTGVTKAVNVQGVAQTTEATTEAETTTVNSTIGNTPEVPTTKPVTISKLISIGKTVTASSVENDSLAAANTVDGDASTRWSSQWTDNEWILMDLGKVSSLDAVELDFEAAYATSYQIYTSFDGEEWYATNFVDGNDHAGKIVSRASVNARYVKVVFNGRGTQYGYSLYAFNVYGY